MEGVMLHKIRHWILCIFFILLIIGFYGCSADKNKPEKIADVDYTIVEDTAIPTELQQLIEEKKTQEFCLSYSEGDSLYLVVGYGQQESAGYSIAVEDLYTTQDSLYVNTELLGPEDGENAAQEVTYPWIVIKTEQCDMMVYFD
jgi:hypothetical protein